MNIASIILAAGQGTRMRSDLPKVLHEVLDRPMVSRVLDAAREGGATEHVVVIGHGRDRVRAAIGTEAGVSFAIQEQQLGTAHAVSCGLASVSDESDRVLILSGDVPNIDGATLAMLAQSIPGPRGASFLTMRVEDPTGYGRVVRTDDLEAQAIVEHKDCNEEQLEIREVNAGIYAVHAAFLREALAQVGSENAAGEFYVTDVIEMAAKADGANAIVVADEAEVAGVNDRGQLALAQAWARDKENTRRMREGVTLLDPSTTWIGRSVKIGRDVVLEPGVCLWGRTVIGAGARIGAHSVLRDAAVAPEEHVAACTVLG